MQQYNIVYFDKNKHTTQDTAYYCLRLLREYAEIKTNEPAIIDYFS